MLFPSLISGYDDRGGGGYRGGYGGGGGGKCNNVFIHLRPFFVVTEISQISNTHFLPFSGYDDGYGGGRGGGGGYDRY